MRAVRTRRCLCNTTFSRPSLPPPCRTATTTKTTKTADEAKKNKTTQNKTRGTHELVEKACRGERGCALQAVLDQELLKLGIDLQLRKQQSIIEIN